HSSVSVLDGDTEVESAGGPPRGGAAGRSCNWACVRACIRRDRPGRPPSLTSGCAHHRAINIRVPSDGPILCSVRIAVITESFLPRVNGVTNSVCRVLEQFAARGHEALVIAAKPEPESYAGHEVAAVGGFALPGYRSFVVGLPMARLVRRLREFQP